MTVENFSSQIEETTRDVLRGLNAKQVAVLVERGAVDPVQAGLVLLDRALAKARKDGMI